MKFQYISDTHLERFTISPKNIIQKINGCENICLLGDIGSPGTDIYNRFIDYCSITWKNVFLLYGNHEYYQTNKNSLAIKTMKNIDDLSNKLPQNVYFLNDNYVYINKLTNDVKIQLKEQDSLKDYIKIIGSLLWSDIEIKISYLMNDYKYIYTSENIKLTPIQTKQFFQESKTYILNQLKEDIQCILLTHHGAHELSNGWYQGNFMSSGYATNIPELLMFNNLIACINGHTHSSINTNIPNTSIKLLSNCYGYKGENKKIINFNPNAILEF